MPSQYSQLPAKIPFAKRIIVTSFMLMTLEILAGRLCPVPCFRRLWHIISVGKPRFQRGEISEQQSTDSVMANAIDF